MSGNCNRPGRESQIRSAGPALLRRLLLRLITAQLLPVHLRFDVVNAGLKLGTLFFRFGQPPFAQAGILVGHDPVCVLLILPLRKIAVDSAQVLVKEGTYQIVLRRSSRRWESTPAAGLAGGGA